MSPDSANRPELSVRFIPGWLMGGWFAVAVASSLVMPDLFWLLLALTGALMAVTLAFHHAVWFSAAWLLIAGATLEMAIGDALGGSAYQTIIAMVKAAEIGLAGVCMLRYGARADPFNPAYAYAAIAALGLVTGLHPGLSPQDSLRSLAGSAAPLLFGFSLLSRSWCEAILRICRLIPLLTVIAAGVLFVAGLRPLFVDSGGWRLAGLGHPAFLGGFCLTAIYAGLAAWLRTGAWRDFALIGINALILLATGARAPMMYAVLVVLGTLLFASSPAVAATDRRRLLLGLAACVPVVLLLAGALPAVRLFNVLSQEATNLSGRDLLWPAFEQAADAAPWFGWGIGAGNFVLSPDGAVAQLIGTWAAHNEYLRMRVEGGYFGLALLLACFGLWARRNISALPAGERVLMRLVFAAFACHAYTDNVLISTSACVFFAFVIAMFARGRMERSSPASIT